VKFKKALLVLTGDADQAIISDTVQWARKMKSKLYGLFVLDNSKTARIARLTHQKTDAVRDKTEEDGWRLLYLVEDEAVSNGVRTSLHFEDGNVVNTLKKYINTYKVDVVVVRKADENKKIFVSSTIPVIGL
jgi:hypothetical protein